MGVLQDLPISDLGDQFKAAPSEKLAWAIIDEYYSFYGSDGMLENIWQMFSITMLADNEIVDSMQRNNVLTFYEFMKVFADAIYFLHLRKLNHSIT